MLSLFMRYALVGTVILSGNVLRVPDYPVSEAPIEALTDWETPDGDGGYSDQIASKTDVMRGLCEKYDFYRVWRSNENQVTQYRVLVVNGVCTYDQDNDTYYFEKGQYYSFNSYSSYVARYYVDTSYRQTNWQSNYSNVPGDGLPGYPGVTNEANKINQQNFKFGLFAIVFSLLTSLINICFFGRNRV